jgi:hypothetical protein
MATGVEKTHPRRQRSGSVPSGKVLKIRGFRPFELHAPQLAHELRFSVQLPVPLDSNFSPATSPGL